MIIEKEIYGYENLFIKYQLNYQNMKIMSKNYFQE